MAEKETLFRMLSRQPWWVSLLVAALLFAAAQLVYPPVAPFVALPFAVVAAIIGYRQARSVSPAVAEDRLARLRGMSWENFSLVVSEAYRRQGYAVEPAAGAGHDLRLVRNGRTTLVQCRRWKVNQVGAGPLRELHEAIERLDAYNGVCIAAGEFSANARAFAAGKPITLLDGAALAELVGSVDRGSRRWLPR
jgi:restriction system protein